MKELEKNQGGITLIALVVTIIVLLILAGITVTTLSGENGLITRTTGAVEKKREAAALEEVKLAMEAIKLDKRAIGEDIVLNIFTEETNVVGRNALEKELYNQDDNVTAVIEDEYLVVDYKGYEFIFDGDFSVTVGSSIAISITPSVSNATLTSLTITGSIDGLDDMSTIKLRYYSFDGGANWRKGGNAQSFVYDGLNPGTTYDKIKVKIELNNGKTYESSNVSGTTLSTSTYLAKIPEGFFTTDAEGTTITGINSSYIENGNIKFNASNIEDEFDGTLIIPATWNGKNVVAIGEFAMRNIGNITTLCIENGITNIIAGAFINCTALNNLAIPNSITQIGEAAFNGCTTLKNITISENVESVGKKSFMGCTGLESITIRNGTIGESAFEGCTSLTSMQLEGVTSFGQRAFSGCTGLTDVVIPSTLLSIETDINYYGSFSNCPNITKITIPQLIVSGGSFYLYNIFSSYDKIEEVNFNGTVTSIGAVAFMLCDKLETINLPSSLTQIGESAFYGCSSLTSITIPANVNTIHQKAFQVCNNLTSIIIKKAEDTIANAPWSATSATITWDP